MVKKNKDKDSKMSSLELARQQLALNRLRRSEYYSDVDKTMPIKQRKKIYAQMKRQISDEKKVKDFEKPATQVYTEAKMRKLRATLQKKLDKYTGRKFLTKQASLRKLKSTRKAMQIAGLTSRRPLRNDRIVYEPIVKNLGGRPRKTMVKSRSDILSQPFIFN